MSTETITQPIQLTESAVQALQATYKEYQKDASKTALRVWATEGGCAGLSYGMAIDEDEPEANDQVFILSGLRVLIDNKSFQRMEGAIIDFIEDEIGGGFKIDNPNAIASCGCGSSFKTEDEEIPETSNRGGGGCGSGGGCCSR